jgi:hypothetical protein
MTTVSVVLETELSPGFLCREVTALLYGMRTAPGIARPRVWSPTTWRSGVT